MYIGLNVQCLLLFRILIIAELSQQIYENHIKFFIKTHAMAELLFHAYTEIHNGANVPISQFYVTF
jgi:hypothetical protein